MRSGSHRPTVNGTTAVKIAVLQRTNNILPRFIWSLRVVQLAKALGQKYVDAARESVDARADIFGKRDQQLGFAGKRGRGQIDNQQRRARETLARELYV